MTLRRNGVEISRHGEGLLEVETRTYKSSDPEAMKELKKCAQAGHMGYTADALLDHLDRTCRRNLKQFPDPLATYREDESGTLVVCEQPNGPHTYAVGLLFTFLEYHSLEWYAAYCCWLVDRVRRARSDGDMESVITNMYDLVIHLDEAHYHTRYWPGIKRGKQMTPRAGRRWSSEELQRQRMRDQDYQKRAEEIWRRNPRLSKNAVAEKLFDDDKKTRTRERIANPKVTIPRGRFLEAGSIAKKIQKPCT